MKVDAHHHLWDLGAVHYPWLAARGVERFFGDPAPIQRNYLLNEFRGDAKGFSGSVHIQVGAGDGLAEARWIQSVADAAPDWPLAQVVFCDLTTRDLPARLDEFQKLPDMRGVRQIIGRAPREDAMAGTGALLDDRGFAEGLRELGLRGLCFDLQLVEEQYERAARLFESVPQTRVALCHAGSPRDRSADGLKSWKKRLRPLADLPNVTCKLSGLGMFDHDWTVGSIRPIVESCLDLFGAHRCMFGSNFPVDSLYSDYGKIVSAYEEIIPSESREAVFGKTAMRHYALECSPAASPA